jgi:phosphate transport system substrate-binding protein
MLKKSDVLPVALALISTVIVVGLGLTFFFKINIADNDDIDKENIPPISEASSQSDLQLINRQTASQEISPSSFTHPGIVPQGTSITVNGSTQMLEINQALKKSFQKQFPGTVINTQSDGSDTGIELLRSGKIHVAAIDRPLNAEEQAAGLVMVGVGSPNPNQKQLYYAYQQPASLEAEVFLGHAFSNQGQQAISNDISF